MQLTTWRRLAKAVWSCALVVVLIAAWANQSHADERELSTPHAALDVVLVFDASGSMLKTDPNNLRYQGAKLLLSVLGGGDRIALVSFAGSAQVVRDLEPVSPATAPQVAQQIENIKTEGAFSDLSEGLKAAKSLLESKARPEAQCVIVLLSDGKMEPDPAVAPAFARTLEVVHDVLPDLKAKEIKVFTLAFSDQADRPFLGEISAATEGLTWFTSTAEDIHKSFADLFLALKRPQVVSQTSRGFKIDDDVEEATFYINREPTAALSLISPTGEEFAALKKPDHVTWFTGQNFDVITIKEPEPGDWRVTGSNSTDGFATVLTGLKLLTDWPLVVRAGDKPLVQARLYDHDKAVSLPEMNGVVTYAFQILPMDKISKPIAQEALLDDGKGADKVGDDGIFSALTEIKDAGEYKLTVVAKGPTFQRSQQIPFTARPRLITLHVQSGEDEGISAERPMEEQQGTAPDGGSIVVSGDERSKFLVKLSKEVLAFREFSVQLVVLASHRDRVEIPVKRSSGSGLELSIGAEKLPGPGEYTLRAVLRAETKKAQAVEGVSDPIRFSYAPRKAPDGNLQAAVSVESKQEEHAEGKKNENEKFPLVPVVGITALNILLFGCLYAFTKRAKAAAGSAGQRYMPHKQLMDAISSLEERTSATKVELTDPIFTVVEAQRSGVAGGAEAPKPTNTEGQAGEA